MGQRVYLKEYDFSLTAGGFSVILAEGAYFRVQSSSGALSIIIDGLGELPGLLAGQGIKDTPFKRLTLRDVSGAANVGKLLVSNEEFIDNRTYGVNSLDAATIASLKLPTPRPESSTGGSSVFGAMTANTPETIFTAAANPNGAVLLAGGLSDLNAGGIDAAMTFLTKATAPTNVQDGSIYCRSVFRACNGASTVYGFSGEVNKAEFVPAGLGLFCIALAATSGSSQRWTRYKLL